MTDIALFLTSLLMAVHSISFVLLLIILAPELGKEMKEKY